MDEGVVEGREDSCDAEHKLAFSDLRTEGDILLSWTGGTFLGRHLCLFEMVVVCKRVRYGSAINVADVRIENNGGWARRNLPRSGLGCQDFTELALFRSFLAFFHQISFFRLFRTSVYYSCNDDREKTTCIDALSYACLTQSPSNLRLRQCTDRVFLVSLLYLQSPPLQGDLKDFDRDSLSGCLISS